MLAAPSRVEQSVALARLHPTSFARVTLPGYRPAELHFRIGDALRRVERGEVKRLMLFIPPRFGKSELSSVRFPAWYLGRHPDRRVILSSYGANLAYSFSRKARNLVASPEYQEIFPGIRPASDSAAVDQWNLQGFP